MKTYSELRKVPLVRILICIIAGILLATNFQNLLNDNEDVLLLLYSIILILLITAYFYKRWKNLFDFLLIPLIISISAHLTIFSVKVPENFQKDSILKGIIYEKPLLKNNSTLLPLILATSSEEVKLNPYQRKIQLYTTRDSLLADTLCVGDEVIFGSSPERIKNYGNPHEFDYAGYMQMKGISLNTFVPSEKIIINKGKSLWIRRQSAILQQKTLAFLTENISNKDALGVASALTLGYKSLISDELRQSYLKAGVIHVLAVSGLHIGIIYLILHIILNPLNHTRKKRTIKFIIVLLFIWMYAILTGLSPSVTRASLMFSLIGLGKVFNRDVSYHNLLALAAIVLLIINPLNLYNLGFQLSFIAVAGIVYYQPLISKWFNSENKIISYFMNLFAVSFAAQIVTTPIILHHFGQFPSYFWVSNLLMIPLITASLISALTFIGLGWISFISKILSQVLVTVISLTNAWVVFIENLPYSVVENINFNMMHILGYFMLLILLTVWFKERRPGIFQGIIVVFCFLLLTPLINKRDNLQNPEIIVYNLPKKNFIGLYSTKESILLCASDTSGLYRNKEFYFNKHWQKTGLNSIPNIITINDIQSGAKNSKKLNSGIIELRLNNNTIGILTQTVRAKLKNKKIYNQLVVFDNVFPDKQISANLIILGSTMNCYSKEKWTKYAQENSLQLIDISEIGAYNITFE